jgi:hypothetical protein
MVLPVWVTSHVFVKENFTAGIAEDCDREEVVYKARQSMGEACCGG